MEMRAGRAFALALAALASAPFGPGAGSPAIAQPARYELGRRYRAFEEALERRSDPAALRAALPHLQTAMRSFFALRPGEAGRALDSARFALEEKGEEGEGGARSDAARLWAHALTFEPDRRLVDPSEGELGFAVRAFYAPEAKKPEGAALRARFDGPGETAAPVEIPLEALPGRGELSLRGAPPGDRAVLVEVVRGAEALASWRVMVSIAARASARIEGLEKRLADLPEGARPLESETARGLLGTIRSLRAGEVLETDYPACRLLEEAEAALAAAAEGRAYYGPEREGQFWLRFPSKRGAFAVRIQVPPEAKRGGALPLVVALHGMGGSENLFFDGYGRGLAVRLSLERGWLVAAPRIPLLGGLDVGSLVEEIAGVYPVDRAKVFLVGHSMGAQAALQAAEASPRSYAAAAALGGGWRVGSASAFRDFPLFLGAGSEDFAFAGVERLAGRLADAGARAVEFRRYPDAEHIAVVALALRDVFGFFDRTARGAGAEAPTGEPGPPAPEPRSPPSSGRSPGNGSRARGRRRAPRA